MRSVPLNRRAWMCVAATLVAAMLSQNAFAAARAKKAEDPSNDLSLILAVDTSSSVDSSRFEVQKQGYVQAFQNPKVWQAIKGGALGKIAVTMFYWTDTDMQQIAVPWMIVKDEATAALFAEAISNSTRPFNGSTSISGAISYGMQLMQTAPAQATRHVIDISGDGSNNLGPNPVGPRDLAVAAGIRINGLPIMTVEPQLDQYYKLNVIGGPGAFIVPVKSYDVFATAILRKLITEISQDQPKQSPQAPRTKLALK